MNEKGNLGLNVLDMINEYANTNDLPSSDIFKKPEPSNALENTKDTDATSNTKKNEWKPDPSLLEGMNEFSGPVTYHKDEIKVSSSNDLKNISDDNAIKDSIETMNELDRKHANIEVAKKRHGIKHLQIPPGPHHVSIFAAAGDTNYKRAQEKLDEIFKDIINTYPEFILEWETTEHVDDVEQKSTNDNISEELTPIKFTPSPSNTTLTDNETNAIKISPVLDESNSDDLKVVIDKTQLSEVSWSPEELAKIKKSRTVELNIVETAPIEFSEIQDIDTNMVDMVLAPYQRKYNDISVALPASRYRATITGLTFVELTDLRTSVEMNTIDAERKKWSICFNHIKNQNIGPWEEYKWYIDPDTRKKIKVGINDVIPNHITPKEVHTVSKFDDFLMKTSYIDLDFIIWKILCATAMESEIITIKCHAKRPDGSTCNKSYDWVYNPADLLRVDLIDPVILDEMKVTGEVSTKEEIINNYNNSPLCSNNTVKLRSSGMSVVFGHISAYDYLNEVFGVGEELNSMIEAGDPSSLSKGYNILMLKSIKSVILPTANGKYARIKGANNIIKVFDTLDEVDWQTIFEISNMMTDPYNFKYSFQNLVCPSCHTRSSIDIENITDLLFVLAQSVASVQVTLKKA